MKTQKKCFLIYNNAIDASSIHKILKNQMIETIDQFVFSSENNLFNNSIREKIKSCSFTLAIVNDFTPNISFEIGISIGLEKPTLMILIKDNLKIPDELKTIQTVRSPLNDIDILTISIEKFLTQNQKGKLKVENKKLKPIEINDSIFQNKISQLEQIRIKGNENELFAFLKDFFINDLAIEKIQISNEIEDRGIDFTIWDYDPSNNLTKPIPVEIKLGKLSQNAIMKSESQMIQIINRFEGNFGLLLYLDREGKRLNQSNSLNPLIIKMDIRDFIEKIKGKSFWNFILEQRNNIAHKGFLNG